MDSFPVLSLPRFLAPSLSRPLTSSLPRFLAPSCIHPLMVVRPKLSPRINHHLQGVRQLILPTKHRPLFTSLFRHSGTTAATHGHNKAPSSRVPPRPSTASQSTAPQEAESVWERRGEYVSFFCPIPHSLAASCRFHRASREIGTFSDGEFGRGKCPGRTVFSLAPGASTPPRFPTFSDNDHAVVFDIPNATWTPSVEVELPTISRIRSKLGLSGLRRVPHPIIRRYQHRSRTHGTERIPHPS